MAPVPTSMRLSSPLLALNPTDRLSGDQNGCDAPSVPASGRADTASKDRSQRLDFASDTARKTTIVPFGDMADAAGFEVGGVVTSRRTSSLSTMGGVRYRVMAVTATATAMSPPSHNWRSRLFRTGTGDPVVGG